jgi:hypothetical protein
MDHAPHLYSATAAAEHECALTRPERRRRVWRVAPPAATGSFGELLARLDAHSGGESTDPERALLLSVLRIVEIDTRSGNTHGMRSRVKRELARAVAGLPSAG